MGNLSHLSNIISFDSTPPTLDQQVRDAMSAVGVQAPDALHFDGTIHRYATSDKAKDSAGWYILYGDNIPSGTFGDWRTGVTHNFRAQTTRELTAADEMLIAQRIAEARKAREAETARRQAMAADTVSRIWDSAGPVGPDHPYLKRKGVQAHMARMGLDGRLILPLYTEDGELSSIQYIDHEGNKLYHAGGKVSACYCQFGDPSNGHKIYVAEGFATAATIAEVMQTPTIAAYSASNLVPVVEILRRKYPTHQIIIVADNDESGTGKNYADQASAKYAAQTILIPEKGMDANDYHGAGHSLQALLEPERTKWLMLDDELESQPSPIKWLVKGWIQDHSLIMVHGPSGCGKTFVVLDWALSIAYKEDWQGHAIHGGSVVYLAGEGHHGLRGRIALWKQERGTGARRFALSRSATDLNDNASLLSAIAEIRTLPEQPKLIVVDTLHRFLNGDENSAQDAKTMIDACARMQHEFDCSVLLVHHTGVSDEAQHRARGSSAWKGALEIEISIRPQGDAIVIEQKKVKDSEMMEPIYARLESKEIKGWLDDDGEPVKSAVVSVTDKPSNRDRALEKDEKIFRDAWFLAGAEVDKEGRPYLSGAALKTFIVDNLGKTDSYARQMIKPAAEGKLISKLISKHKVAEHMNGFSIIDDDFSESCLLAAIK
jgi:putative DNA primase/helicase